MKFNLAILSVFALIISVVMTSMVMAVPFVTNDTFTIYTPTVNLEEAAIIANDDPLLSSTYLDFSALNVSAPFRGEITGFDGYLGLFNYTNNGTSGVDYFTYVLTNCSDTSGLAYVIMATSDNTAPSFNFTTRVYTNSTNNTLEVNALDGLLSNVTNIENDKLFIILTENVHFGNLTIGDDGSFNYTSNKTNGIDFFKYKISDLSQTSSEILVLIKIGNNTAPVALADNYSISNLSVVLNDVNITGSVMTNDSDAESDVLFAYLNQTTQNGTLTFHSDGTFEYYPNVSFSGIDSFTYFITDQDQNSSSVNVTLYVNVTMAVDSGNTGGSSSSGGSSGGIGVGGPCITKWNCTEWSSCTNSTQTRTCSYPSYYCAPTSPRPALAQACGVAGNNSINPGSEDKTGSSLGDKISGTFSAITGAVIGLFAKTSNWALAFVVLVVVAFVALLVLKKRKAKSKNNKGK